MADGRTESSPEDPAGPSGPAPSGPAPDSPAPGGPAPGGPALGSPEEILFDDGQSVMDTAVSAAAKMLPAQSPEVLEAARERAAHMLRDAKQDDTQGLKDLQNLTLSMGLSSARATFRFMIRAAGLRGAARAEALKRVADFSGVTEVGCMKVDFFNRATGRADIAYLVLDQCPREHDLGAQLDKLKRLVSDEKWPEVIRHLSMLVFIGRSVYGQTARKHVGLIRQIFDAKADDPCTRYLDLQVDPKNTTLFLDASWPNRVGLHVRLETELSPGGRTARRQ